MFGKTLGVYKLSRNVLNKLLQLFHKNGFISSEWIFLSKTTYIFLGCCYTQKDELQGQQKTFFNSFLL